MSVPPELDEQWRAQAVVDAWSYQTDSALLFPYVPQNSVVKFPDDFLVSLYFRMRDQGLLELVFPGHERTTLNTFIHRLYPLTMVVALAKPAMTVGGMGWLWEVDGRDGERIASVGFTFFNEVKGTAIPRDGGRLAIRWWLRELKVNQLYGSILESNRMAINYALRLGFQSLCTVPRRFPTGNGLADARLVTLNGEDFLQREAFNGRSFGKHN